MKKKILISVLIIICFLIAIGLIIYNNVIKDSENYIKNLAVVKNIDSESQNLQEEVSRNDSPGNQTTPSIQQKKETSVEESDFSDVINILFLGIDRTEDREKYQDYYGIYRSDTILLSRVNMATKKVKVLCIPRDTYAYIPIKDKKDKIGHAYAYGSAKKNGVEATIKTVNNFLGQPSVDYYFTINMEPIPQIVDSFGGIMLDVELDMKTHDADVSKGLQLLDGKKAFDYIHWRYAGNGDIDRIKRQQKFAKAMYKKLRDEGNLVQAVELLLKYNNDVKTNLTVKQLISFAKLCTEIPESSITYTIIPGHNAMINKASFWIPDEDKTEKMINEFFSD